MHGINTPTIVMTKIFHSAQCPRPYTTVRNGFRDMSGIPATIQTFRKINCRGHLEELPSRAAHRSGSQNETVYLCFLGNSCILLSHKLHHWAHQGSTLRLGQ